MKEWFITLSIKRHSLMSIALLLATLVMGGVLRLIALDSIPSGFYRDEAAIGYNSYSLLLTGKDEYGQPWPLAFRSFEDFKAPLYEYLAMPSIAIFDLTPFATRLPAAVFGILTILVCYLLTKELFGNRIIAHLVALLMAFSPWAIFFSRGAWEANVGLFFFTAATYFFLKAARTSQPLMLVSSFAAFVLSAYAYHAQRFVAPFFIFVLWWLYKDQIRHIKSVNKIVIISLLLALPLIIVMATPGGSFRARELNIFSPNKTPPGVLSQQQLSSYSAIDGFLVNQRLFWLAHQFSALYVSYFSPRNLFVEGSYDPQHGVENHSVMYAWEFPFLVVGSWYLVKNNPKKVWMVIMGWLLLAPIPASLNSDPFHTIRSLLMVVPLEIIVAVGIYHFGKVMLSVLGKVAIFPVVGLIAMALFSTLFFVDQYFIVSPYKRAASWEYGYRQIVDEIKRIPPEQPVVVDNKQGEPYIHFLFHLKYPPQAYQLAAKSLIAGDYYFDTSKKRVNDFDRYTFRPVDWSADRGNLGTVFVASEKVIPFDAFVGDRTVRVIKKIYYPDGKLAYMIVEIVNPDKNDHGV